MLDSPPFDKALVDGYAVRSSDLQGTDRWLAAGRDHHGGPDAVSAARAGRGGRHHDGCSHSARMRRRRDARANPAAKTGVLVLEPEITSGQNLMVRGREMRAGEVVVARGSILGPARLGVLAAIGRSEVQVVPRQSVAIVPTGDELVEPGQVPGPGQIRNSNAAMLQALAIEAGADRRVLPIAPDLAGPLRHDS